MIFWTKYIVWCFLADVSTSGWNALFSSINQLINQSINLISRVAQILKSNLVQCTVPPTKRLETNHRFSFIIIEINQNLILIIDINHNIILIVKINQNLILIIETNNKLFLIVEINQKLILIIEINQRPLVGAENLAGYGTRLKTMLLCDSLSVHVSNRKLSYICWNMAGYWSRLKTIQSKKKGFYMIQFSLFSYFSQKIF